MRPEGTDAHSGARRVREAGERRADSARGLGTARAALLAAAFALASAGPALAQKAPTLNLPWARDAKDAKQQASAAKKPIAVVFIQNTCRLSMHMVKALHEDGRLYGLSGNLVWLCVDPTRKEDFEWFLGECGDSVEGTPTLVFLNESGQTGDPNLAGVEPVSGADPDRIVSEVRKLLGRYKKDIGEAEKRAFLEGRKAAEEAAAAEPGKALALYREAIRAAEGWSSMEEAVQACRDASEEILRGGMERVREALARRAPPAESSRSLQALRDAYGDSPPGRWAAREAERIRGRKG